VDYATLSCVHGHNSERRRAYGVRDAGSAFRAPDRPREPWLRITAKPRYTPETRGGGGQFFLEPPRII